MTVSGKMMRAVVLHGIGDLRIEERPVPQPGPDEVLVRVTAVGICGSDVHYVQAGRIGGFVVEAPLVLGHEPAGEIVAVGDGVAKERVGQRVSIEPGRPCLECRQCLGGRYNLCPAMQFFATPPVDGALCEYVVVHHAFAHPVPNGLSDDSAALLEPLSVGVWACRRGGVGPGRRVLVTGAGPVGLLALQSALAYGASEVVITDVDPIRLAAARERGATAAIDARDLRDHGELELEVLLECSGSPAALRDGLHILGPGGRAVLIGAGATDISVPIGPVQARELEIVGLFRYANTWPTAIAMVEAGQVDLDSLVTSRIPLEKSLAPLSSEARMPGDIKTVVLPQE